MQPDATRLGATTDQALAPKARALFILPARRGNGLVASIRGRLIDLVDPTDDPFGPTPDELLVLSIASDLGWFARRFLRGQGLVANVNIAARWQTVGDPPALADVSVTVTVPPIVATIRRALLSALEERVAALALDDLPRVHIEPPDVRTEARPS